MEKITASIRKNQSFFHEKLRPDLNFDVVERPLLIGGREAYFYCINGFVADDNLQKVIQFFLGIKPADMPEQAADFAEGFAAFGDVVLASEVEKLMTPILSGLGVLLVDGYTQGLIFDIRDYPGRGVQEPEKDKVQRGARDGFCENLVVNTALIRRRIRDPRLRLELFQIGEVSRTDVAVVYMEEKVNRPLLEKIKKRLETLQVDSLTMGQESLAECIYRNKWYNPLPKFKFSERPDTTAAHLMEGNLAVLVDNSPAAMILPSSIFDLVEAADDYYFPPITGTYLRLARILISLVALFLLPIYLLLMQNPQWVPPWLAFIRPAEAINVPLVFQIFILELAVDGLRLASVNTPNMLSTPLSIIAALVLGDFSVQSGWFNSEIMLYTAFVTVANYAQTSFELGYAIKFFRMLLVFLTALFDIWGFLFGVLFIGWAIAVNHSIGGTSYLYPLIPFRWKEIKKRILRPRITYSEKEKDKDS